MGSSPYLRAWLWQASRALASCTAAQTAGQPLVAGGRTGSVQAAAFEAQWISRWRPYGASRSYVSRTISPEPGLFGRPDLHNPNDWQAVTQETVAR